MAIGGAFPNTQIRIDTRRAHTGSARQDGLLLNLDAQRQPVSCRPPATRMAPLPPLATPSPPPHLPRHTGTRTRRQTWFQKGTRTSFKLTELQNSLRLRPASKSFYESAHRRTLNRKPANGLLAPRAP